jgi:hypothetical protein
VSNNTSVTAHKSPKKEKLMKPLFVSLVCCVILSFTLMACSDNPAPTESATVSTQSVAVPLAKTAGPGAWVFRYQDVLCEGWVVPDEGIMFTWGVNDLGLLLSSGWVAAAEMVDVKDVLLPNADPTLRRLLDKAINKDATIYVWDISSWEGTFFSTIAKHAPIATGVGKLSWLDTDELADGLGSQNTDVFGWKANGVLLGVDGRTHTLKFTNKIMWKSSDPDKFHYVLNFVYTPR